MSFIDRNGVKIHWQEQGEGTPVLLIMGLRFSSAMWYPVIPSHSFEHRVIWFDNRGTGESDAPKAVTVDDMVGDALAVLDAADVEQAHVYGVSMGGGIAMELALQAPERVRSLILGCTAIKTEVLPGPKPLLVAVLKHTPRWIMSRLGGGKLYGTAAPADAVAKDTAMLKADTFDWDGVRAQANAIAEYTTDRSAVAAIDLPTLVLHGTTDATVPYAAGQDIAATIPGARLVTFDNAGHNFIVADTEKANTATLEFMAGVDATAAEPQTVR